jgi:hypothetical protein
VQGCVLLAAAALPPPLPPPPRLDLRVPPSSQFVTASLPVAAQSIATSPAAAESSDDPVPTAAQARGSVETLASSSSTSPPRGSASFCVKLFLPILLNDITRVAICV